MAKRVQEDPLDEQIRETLYQVKCPEDAISVFEQHVPNTVIGIGRVRGIDDPFFSPDRRSGRVCYELQIRYPALNDAFSKMIDSARISTAIPSLALSSVGLLFPKAI